MENPRIINRTIIKPLFWLYAGVGPLLLAFSIIRHDFTSIIVWFSFGLFMLAAAVALAVVHLMILFPLSWIVEIISGRANKPRR